MAPLALIILLLVVSCVYAEVINVEQPRQITDLATHVHRSAAESTTADDNALTLLDILLVASVDGRLHALNRTSGEPLWSMASLSQPTTTEETNARSTPLTPLVSTRYTSHDSDDQETYIMGASNFHDRVNRAGSRPGQPQINYLGSD